MRIDELAILSDMGERQEKDSDPDGSGREPADAACSWPGTAGGCYNLSV